MKQPDGSDNLTLLTQSELFQKISDICAAVNTATSAKDLLEISLRKTMALFKAQRGSIYILSENGRDLELKIAEGMAGAEERDIVKKLGEGVVGQVAISKKPIVVSDIANDERFANFKARQSYHTSSFICAPLLIKDKLIGVINITDKGSGSRFSQNELQLLDFLSSQIALNYRRIQLYQKFKSIVKESQSLKDELGKSSQEATHLKRQIIVHEKLASIGKLAGGIAHEFNNPLDGVIRYTNLCLEHVSYEDEVIRGYLLEIKNGLNRMANIVRSLLACARVTEPPKQELDLNQAIQQSIQALQGQIMDKKITIFTHLAQGLPTIIDYGLERVITNLVSNAIDAITNEGCIEVTTAHRGNQLIIEVRDNGCGIDIGRQPIEQLFEPFYTTKEIDKGCGLGLTIVSEVVKNYNGEIDVVSSPGQGTTFTILLPLVEATP